MSCVVCRAPATGKCSLCQSVTRCYCSAKCQTLDWPIHQLQHQSQNLLCQKCGAPASQKRIWHGMTFCCCSDACFDALTEKVNLSTDIDGRITIGHDSHVGRFVLYMYKLFGLSAPTETHTVLPTFIGTSLAPIVSHIGLGLDEQDIQLLKTTTNDEQQRIIIFDRVKPNSNPKAIFTALAWACEEGHVLAFTLLVIAGMHTVDFAYDNNYLFRTAALNGHIRIVRILMGKDVDVEVPKELYGTFNSVDITALHNYALRWACAKGRDQIVALLLDDRRINATARNNEALRRATENGQVAIIWMLLKWSHDTYGKVDPNDAPIYAKPNERKLSAVEIAKKHGYKQIIEEFKQLEVKESRRRLGQF